MQLFEGREDENFTESASSCALTLTAVTGRDKRQLRSKATPQRNPIDDIDFTAIAASNLLPSVQLRKAYRGV